MNSQWLSLTEYASKYGISVSTLRRRIRKGQISVDFKFGKYFIKDQSPKENILKEIKKTTEVSNLEKKSSYDFLNNEKKVNFQAQYEKMNMQDQAIANKKNIEPYAQYKTKQDENLILQKNPLDDIAKKDTSQGDTSQKQNEKNISSITSILNKFISSQELFYEQIKKKEEKIFEQHEEIIDLRTLVNILEKENKDLKSLLHKEKEMEEWLEM